jgi:hypothetical protein
MVRCTLRVLRVKMATHGNNNARRRSFSRPEGFFAQYTVRRHTVHGEHPFVLHVFSGGCARAGPYRIQIHRRSPFDSRSHSRTRRTPFRVTSAAKTAHFQTLTCLHFIYMYVSTYAPSLPGTAGTSKANSGKRIRRSRAHGNSNKSSATSPGRTR